MESLESIPSWLSDTLDVSLEAAQVLLSLVVILAVLLPILYLGRGSKSLVIPLMMVFLTSAFLVGIGWLPFWILIAAVAVLAFGIATLGVNAVTGD